MIKLHKITIFILLFVSTSNCFGQHIDSTITQIQQLPDKYYLKVDQKLKTINDKLTKNSVKYLAKFQRQEKKLQNKFGNLNSDATKVFANSTAKYTVFGNSMKSKISTIIRERGVYNSYLDTLSTSLAFLKKFTPGKAVAKPIESLAILQNKLQQSEKIKEFVGQRKQQIKELLSKYTKLPSGLAREYAKLNKAAYYYSSQVNEYKEMLKDPSKIEQRALSILNKLPAFQNFMKKNSQLSSLFRIPGTYSNSESIEGLQTRSSVQELFQKQMGVGAPNAKEIMQKSLAQAKSELGKLKDKINKYGVGDSNIEMPDFNPNKQKTKPFLKRMQYGANIQFAKRTNLFPSTADIGLSIGYKINQKSVIGIGLGYKLGMGTIRRVVFSHQGVGLRSFADYKIKNSIYVSGGFEMNYNATFKNIEKLKNFNDWTSSGLIGVSKKYAVNKKVKGEMKFLYDFLATTHMPVTQPFIFRVGYNLK